MKTSITPLILALLLASCDQETKTVHEPKTPEEMYARAEALLKPNAENDASDFQSALHYLKQAAAAGYLQAQTDLGGLYMAGGKGIEADWDQAYEWFSKAAQQGSSSAHQFLAIILQKGTPTKAPNFEAAITHLEHAASDKLPEAMNALGHIYINMEGKAKEGYQLLEEAGQAGMADAARDLGFLYASGTKDLHKDMAKATHLFQQAAALGDAQSLYIVGLMQHEGQHLEKDVDKGLAALRLAAGQGFVPAMKSLSLILSRDEASPEMKQEAAAWRKHLDTYEAQLKKDADEAGHDLKEAVEEAPVTMP